MGVDIADRDGQRPIVIKRKRVVAPDGHHGGHWKVAFADFATAMMAFFLMLWLLGMTTDDQRAGLADYFTPTVSVLRTPAGGDGLLGDGSPGVETRMGGSEGDAVRKPLDTPDADATDRRLTMTRGALAAIEGALHAAAQTDDPEVRRAVRQMITRITDQGLTVELYDLEDSPLFLNGGTEASEVLMQLSTMLADAFGDVLNSVAIDAHVRAHAVVERDARVWDLSTARALAMRELLVDRGLDERRLKRLTGHGDRIAAEGNPIAVRNNRIVLTLQRQG